MGADPEQLVAYAGLVILAFTSIYLGAFSSLPKPKRTGAPSKDDQNKEEEEEEEDVMPQLASEDAWLFPVIGSVALFGLYAAIKYFGKEWINILLGWYFSVAGVASVSKPSGVLSLSWRTPTFFLFPLGTLPSILFSVYHPKSAVLTNILGLSFANEAMSLLKLDSFQTGCILLAGLFFYDIWWVFGTEVMVHVATNLDLPIKILWPKSIMSPSSRGSMMLGLGDIVIPGIFVALALRYDYHRHTTSTSTTSRTSVSKPYFYAALSAYVAGLGTTMAVMHIFHAAQPALLYLSPACIMAYFITASVRGELKESWAWSDEPPAARDQKDDSAASKKAQ
ncbi:hypothetical protein EWM64_g10548 [Hericium alpestre]|uniref:Peptidase A22B, signal peptide peptidase n=1 Tax=Hericium alpestre TaxID=135208 RepID=A0A4Y9ZGB7_9AGAM|nr:hypothetical protein EWM64_g10548 [Hericium alpestre]